jgi:ferredoxin--NADP+ reductase
MHDSTHTAAALAESAAPNRGLPLPLEDTARSAPITVAVIGSGPSGCYLTQFLTKRWPEAEVTIFETLPTPYGLVRYGVAADHQGAKAVTRQFDRLFTRADVRFAGNVTVGRDITFELLVDTFDVVAVATGLPVDRALDIPQHQQCRVIGAGTLLRALNGFPSRELLHDDTGRVSPLGPRLAVVGMGNVSLDVIRLLAKDIDDFSGSDIDDELLAQLRPHAPLTFDVIGRSPAAESKFDLAMLRELIALPKLDVHVTGIPDSDQSPAAQLLRPLARAHAKCDRQANPSRTRLNLHFRITPQGIESRHGRTVLHALRRGDTKQISLTADTVITAIGFTHARPDDGACAPTGWAGQNVYRVGWFSRGATGAIPENRKDAQRVAEAIVDDVTAGRVPVGKVGFRAVEHLLADRLIGFADWQRIEAFERRNARRDRCRQKITDIDQMITVATTPESATFAPAPSRH